ncbi:MAG TPA: hypothetical protein VHW43_07870, partial [Puia sp.]|nr:hypothetical protein [Puia sp.]
YLYVKGILAAGPCTTAADAGKIDAFLLQLKQSTINCRRLLICIGIDLKNFSQYIADNKSCPDKAFVTLLREAIVSADGMPAGKSVPKGEYTYAMRFARALKSKTTSHPPVALNQDSPAGYFRISPFINYMRYIVANNLKSNPDLPASLDLESDELVEEYFEEFIQKERYNKLTITKLGPKNSWIFVVDKADLQSRQAGGNQDLHDLADMLGLDINPVMIDHRYVCLEYPENFAEPVYQPSSLMADWGSRQPYPKGNEFFLSYSVAKQWGRTWSVSGNRAPIKERTHTWFDHGSSKTYEFSAAYLGRLTSVIQRGGDEQIIQEALKRFDEA